MFKFTVDQTLLEMTNTQNYEYSSQTYQNVNTSNIHIGPSYDFRMRMENMEHDLKLLMEERNEMQKFVDSHPAVKEAWEKFLVIKAIAKVENEGCDGGG